jgi:hypothetical protein
VTSPQFPYLRDELVDRSVQRRPIVPRFAKRDDVSLLRRVEYDFDSLHRAILLKADNCVNCTRNPSVETG